MTTPDSSYREYCFGVPNNDDDSMKSLRSDLTHLLTKYLSPTGSVEPLGNSPFLGEVRTFSIESMAAVYIQAMQGNPFPITPGKQGESGPFCSARISVFGNPDSTVFKTLDLALAYLASGYPPNQSRFSN